MGAVRSFSPHRRWSAAEIAALTNLYPSATHAEITAEIPDRGIRVIQCKANALGLVRLKAPKMTPDEVRAMKREHMARRRAADPDGHRAYQRAQHALNKDKRNAKLREYNARRLFRSRANRLKGISALDLARLWKAQRGLCALTGRKMDRAAEVDHIVPKARGGGDEIGNLRWVCCVVNRAKRDLLDGEFEALCSDVMRWIGRRIEAVRGLDAAEAA